jgi:hypothetical protein
MPPELYFALTLLVKMAVTAGFLLAATIIAERAGPLVGGLFATLPISAGPVYVFLAMDHDAHFIGQAALGSLTTNAINVAFAVAYAVLAQKRSMSASLTGAYAVWVVLFYATTFVPWSLPLALVLNAAMVAIAMWIVHPLRDVRVAAVQARWYDLLLRAALVAVLVGTVVTLSFTIGPRLSGSITVVPIVLTSIIIILHRRIGGPATAAILANAVVGLGSFGIAIAALYLTAEQLGSPLALSLTLAISIGCNLMLYVMRKRAATA